VETPNFKRIGWPVWAASGLIVVFLIAAFSEARLKSPTSDEPPHIAAGLSYFVTHEIFRANPQHPPLLKELAGLSLMASGVRWPNTPDANYLVNGDDPARVFGLDWPVGNDIIAANGPDRVLLWARTPMILIGALLGVVLFLWGRQLFGPVAAVAAVLIWVLDPIVFAHSQFVTTDVGSAAVGLLALYALWNYLLQPGWKRLIWTGLAFGAALTTKFSAAFLLPIAGVLLLASLRWPIAPPPKAATKKAPAPRQYYRSIWVAGAVLGAAAFAVVQLTYFFPADATMYLRCAQMVNADHNPDYLMYMAGGLSRNFPGYFGLAYLLKEPIAAIVLTAIGLAAIVRSQSLPVLAKWFVLLPPAVFFLAVTFMADNLGVRYLMPALPFAHLFAGVGIATLVDRARVSRAALAAGAVLGVWLVVAAAGIYPDQISYFNEAACLLTEPGRIGVDGGTRCGPKWLDDSNVDWGQGFKQLKTWLDRNAPGRPLNFAFTTPFPPEAYGIQCRHLKSEDLYKKPEPGLYVVSAHLVARTPATARLAGQDAEWLRTTQPVAIVGHALYVYDIGR
jgi:hypothetical protein